MKLKKQDRALAALVFAYFGMNIFIAGVLVGASL